METWEHIDALRQEGESLVAAALHRSGFASTPLRPDNRATSHTRPAAD